MKDDNKCVHCGADCGKKPVIANGLKFCCNGCKTVYLILNENKLYKYYDIEETPGIKINYIESADKYAYLDKEEVQEQIFNFVEGDIAKVNFFIPVIHCASCIWLLENLRALNKGIRSSYVHFTKKEVSITFNKSEISLRQLVELLVSIHYVPEITVGKDDKKDKEARSSKILLYKLGVAGFVFGNVMTYSLPEYFSGEPLSPYLSSMFRILSYILIIPVVFFSANDYFISAYKNLIKKNINIDLPIALGVSVLFITTSYEVISNNGSGYSDSIAGLIFFLLLGKNIQNRTYRALSFDRDYKSYFPIAVTKLKNDKEESVLLKEIEKDDIIIIRSKELIPADSVLISGEGLIDYSFVTGESAPVRKKEGNFIYAGGRQTGGIIKVKVEKKVEQSHLTKLWNQSETESSQNKGLKSITDKVSEYFTVIIILIAIAGFIFRAANGDYSTAVFVFTAVLIVACPCALALSLPFTLGNAMKIFGNKGLYVKNISVIEKLTKTDTLVFDKTGTITKPDENQITYSGEPLTDNEKQAVFSLAKQSTHPLSYALSKHLSEFDYIKPEHYVEPEGRGIFGKIGSYEIKIGSEKFVKETDIASKQKNSVVFVSINNKFRGYFSVKNKYREGFENVINNLRKSFDIYLLSGDNDSEKETLSAYFNENRMHFEQKPQDKKDFIKNLQNDGRTVLMTGDGLNDSGALMQSDIALSVADNVYHFSPAGDAVLEAAKFHKLSDFIRFTKTSLNIVKISFIISFLYNIVGISFALAGALSPVVAAILMPLSSISVVAFATFATILAGRKI